MGLLKGIALTKHYAHSLKKKIYEPRLVYFLMKQFSPLKSEPRSIAYRKILLMLINPCAEEGLTTYHALNI